MRKQTTALIALILLLTSLIPAQRSKSNKNEQPVIAAPQISLDQRLGELSREISDELTGNQKTTVAVAEFVDLKGGTSDFGKFLAEELTTRLFKTKKLKVIERQLLNKVIAEQKLSLTEIIEASAAKRIGRILGVDAIVSGTISDLGKTLKINARIINTETGEVFAAAGTEVVKDESVCNLIGCSGIYIVGANTLPTTPTKSQPPPTPKPKPTATPKPIREVPTTWKVDSNFFTFDLQRCRLSGTNVICDFIITNNDRDRKLALAGNSSSKMYDELNNTAQGGGGEIANSGKQYQPEVFLVNGIATRARIYFENVSPDATRIARMDIKVWAEGGDWFSIQYRNIPLRDQTFLENNSDSNTQASTQSKPQNQTTFKVYPNQQWTDSGIDVSPGMKLDILVGGVLTVKVDNPGASKILSGILKRSVDVPPTTKTVGPNALISKIRYTNGNDSNILTIGGSNTLIVEEGEFGRLYFGVNQSYSDSSGYFTVNVKW